METITKQVIALSKNDDTLTFLCNTSALLKEYFNNTNWLGFYLYKNEKLHLGPFQGKVACEVIDIGKGVCGNSIAKRKVLNIKNVHEFEGHIACDSASNSEIVLPLIDEENIYGVLDIDSELLNRFSSEDENLLIEIAKVITERLSKTKDNY